MNIVIFLFISSCAIHNLSDEQWELKTLELLRVIDDAIDDAIESAKIRITRLENEKLPVLKRLIDLDDAIERNMRSKTILEDFAQTKEANKEAQYKVIEVYKIRKIHLESVKLPLLKQFRSLDNVIERTKIRITHLESVKLQFAKYLQKTEEP